VVITINKLKDISYKLIANLHMWYILLFLKQGEKRLKLIYAKWYDMQMSSLYMFVTSIIVTLTITIILEKSWLPLATLLFGGNLILTKIVIRQELSHFWEWKEKKDEEELRIREAAKQKRREQEELERKRAYVERMRQFYEQQQRAQQQSQSVQLNNEFIYHLSNLGLTSDCRDMSLIKKAYRNLMKKHHPDINKSMDSAEITKTIVASYKFLEKKVGLSCMKGVFYRVCHCLFN